MYVLLLVYAMYVVLFAKATTTTVQALYLFGWHGLALWQFSSTDSCMAWATTVGEGVFHLLLHAGVWHWLLQLVRVYGIGYCSMCLGIFVLMVVSMCACFIVMLFGVVSCVL